MRFLRIIGGTVLSIYGAVRLFLDWYGRVGSMNDIPSSFQHYLSWLLPALPAALPWILLAIGIALLLEPGLRRIWKEIMALVHPLVILFDVKDDRFFRIESDGNKEYMVLSIGVMNRSIRTISNVSLSKSGKELKFATGDFHRDINPTAIAYAEFFRATWDEDLNEGTVGVSISERMLINVTSKHRRLVVRDMETDAMFAASHFLDKI
jgi:hypothetical protein